jgi:hypothetical protein
MVKCVGKDKDKKSCKNDCINDNKFCKFHQYMNDYTENMLNNLTLCKTCRKMRYFEGELKTCEHCIKRINKLENNALCSKDGCKFKRSNENIYCGKHQLCLFEDEVKLENKKLCFNYIRGCREKLDIDYKFSKCGNCLEYDREKDKKRRINIKENNSNIDVTNAETKYCTTCCKELSMDNFVGALSVITKTCIKCRENNKKQDANRDKDHRNEVVRNNMKPQFTTYKKGAYERNLEFVISYDEYETIVKNKCYYCGIMQERGFNGIDRKDSSIGYNLINCVSCCKMCNYIKGSLSVSVFIKRIEHILTYQAIISGKLHPECFANHKKSPYNNYFNRAIKMGMEFSLSIEQYNEITNGNCYICGKINDENNENGMDRFNNNYGYTLDNVRSCCAECNCMKIDYNTNDLYDKFINIYLIHSEFCNLVHDNSRNYRFGNK